MKITALLAVVLVVVIGIIVFLTVKPSGEERLLERSIENLLKLDRFKENSEFYLKVEGSQNGEITLTSASSIDKSTEQWKADTDIDISIVMEEETTLQAKMMTDGEDLYLKLNSIPNLPLLFFDSSILEYLSGQWILLEGRTLGDMVGEDTQNEAMLEDLKKLFADNTLFVIDDNLGEENGSTHYVFSVDKESLKDLIPQYLDLFKKYVPQEQLANYEADVDQAVAQLNQNIDDAWVELNGISVDAWITNEGTILERVDFLKEFDLSDFNESQTGSFAVGIDMRFSDFDGDFEIEMPSGAIKFEDLFAPTLE